MYVDLECRTETSGARALGGIHEHATDVSPAFGAYELLSKLLDGVKRLQGREREAASGADVPEEIWRRALLHGDAWHFVRIGPDRNQPRLARAERAVAELFDELAHARRGAAARQRREVHRL